MIEKEKIIESEIELKVTDDAAAEALPSVIEQPPPKQLIINLHSLMHRMTRANCNAKWWEMKGDDRVRQCNICKTNAYKIEGLDEAQLLGLLNQHEPDAAYNPAKNSFYRRQDGTVMLQPGFCVRKMNTIGASAIAAIVLGMAWVSADLVSYQVVQCMVLLATSLLYWTGRIFDKRAGRKTHFGRATLMLLIAAVCGLGTSLLIRHYSAGFAITSLILALVALFSMLAFFYHVVAATAEFNAKAPPAELSTASADQETQPKRPSALKAAIIGAVVLLVGIAAIDLSWTYDFMKAVGMSHINKKVDTAPLQAMLHRASGDRADLTRVMIAALDVENKNYSSAEDEFNKTISDLEGKDINNLVLQQARYGLANALFTQHRYAEALAEVGRLESDFSNPRNSQGGFRIAFGWYTAVPGFDPSDMHYNAQLLKAKILDAQGNTADAEKILKRALMPNPRTQLDLYHAADALDDYIAFLKKHNRMTDATKAAEKFEYEVERSAEPDSRGTALRMVARVYHSINDTREGKFLEYRIAAEDKEQSYSRTDARLAYAAYLAHTLKNDAMADNYFRDAIAVAGEDCRRCARHMHEEPNEAEDYDVGRASRLYAKFLRSRHRDIEANLVLSQIAADRAKWVEDEEI